MTLLQLGIGTVNDIVDAPLDAGRKAGKPIPAGLVARVGGAVGLAVVAFGSGSLSRPPSSLATGVLAVVVIAIGLAYDLRLKGTAWSWLPFAVGIPILPVFGWVGATGTLAPVFARPPAGGRRRRGRPGDRQRPRRRRARPGGRDLVGRASRSAQRARGLGAVGRP